MASIYQYTTADGTRRYGVRWRDAAGRQRFQLAGTRRKDALVVKQEVERRLLLGPMFDEPPEPFGVFLDGWLNRHGQRVRTSTISRYREVVPHLAPLRPVDLDRLKPATVEDLVLAIARVAPRQAELALRIVKMAAKDARARGQRIDDGLLAIKPPRREAREIRFLTWAEVEELASCTPGPYHRLVMMAALTGLRQGELFGLRDRDLDLPARTARITAASRDGETIRLKTAASRRSVYLCETAAALLEHQLTARIPNRAGLVFTAPEGGAIRKDNFMARIYRPAVRRAGLAPLRFHDLRHTYAALMVAAGSHPKLLQAQMGHSSITVTLDLYGHLYPEMAAPIAAALDRLVHPDGPEGASRYVQSLCNEEGIPRR